MHPRSGGRAVLDLAEIGETQVRYRAELFTPDHAWQGEARIALEGGALELAAWAPSEPTPPAWLVEYARAFLRSAWRAHREAGWPSRINRWRDERP